jgi:hypothetical protein
MSAPIVCHKDSGIDQLFQHGLTGLFWSLLEAGHEFWVVFIDTHPRREEKAVVFSSAAPHVFCTLLAAQTALGLSICNQISWLSPGPLDDPPVWRSFRAVRVTKENYGECAERLCTALRLFDPHP